MNRIPFHSRPALLASLLLLGPGCTEDSPDADVGADKAEQAEGHGGKADGVDICAAWDWYDDDFCDDPYGWCDLPDPDCGADGDTCPQGSTWSGLADEGCIADAGVPAVFSEPEVIGARGSTAFELRAWARVAVDHADRVHVVYVGQGTQPTYAAEGDGWQPHVLDEQYVRGGLAVAADTQVHVAYVDSSYRLRSLLVDDAVVVDRDDPVSVAHSVGIAVGPSDTHIVHGSGSNANRLTARTGEIGDMQVQPISDLGSTVAAPESPAVVVDQRGGVHVSYGTRPAAYDFRGGSVLRYAHRDPTGTWSDEVVVGATRDGGSLTVSANGAPLAVYRGFVDGEQTLMSAQRRDGTEGPWEVSPVFGPGVYGASPAVATAGDGTLHVVYRASGSVLQHASRPLGEGWSEQTVLDPSVAMSASDRVSLAIASDDALHIVYSDTQTREVRYVTRP
ncbi:MAG: hypothetical protein ACRBN8_24485 [Nannocystales bacterium]